MDTERKYPTREVDGVDVPQMGIKELIKQLGAALETMEGNRKSYTSPEEIAACLWRGKDGRNRSPGKDEPCP